MNKTKFFEKVGATDCDEYPFHLIITSYSYSSCAKYKAYAAEWNDNNKNKSKTVHVDCMAPLLAFYVPRCTVTVACKDKNI